jgi:hypothetical protein
MPRIERNTARDSRAARMLSHVDVHGRQSIFNVGAAGLSFGMPRLKTKPKTAIPTRVAVITPR